MGAMMSLWDCREIVTLLDFIVIGIALLATTVAVATMVTMATPTNTNSKTLRVLNVLAGNVGKNRNADDPRG